jgi:N-acetylglutamate synthase-like GNAT family acetyltransferase
MAYELTDVTAQSDWHAYHALRRHVLWELRGRSDYDDNRPEERFASNHPLLLKLDSRGIGTTRLDDLGRGRGVVRLVAVAADLQRRGHGRVLSALVDAYAHRLGLTTLLVNAAPEAIGYYEKMGWKRYAWDATELIGIAADSIQMRKGLT